VQVETLRNLPQQATARTVSMLEKSHGEWVDLGYMAEKTGFDDVTLLRLIESGDLPVMQVASAKRTSHKIPRRLVDEAYAAVMAGAQVELRAFCRSWSARNAADPVKAVALDDSP
jgi:hypothetical protein